MRKNIEKCIHSPLDISIAKKGCECQDNRNEKALCMSIGECLLSYAFAWMIVTVTLRNENNNA